MDNLLLTEEEWKKLSPMSRHRINVFAKNIETIFDCLGGGPFMPDLLLTEEEWEKLLPESRQKLSAILHEVSQFVRSLYTTKASAEWKLRQLGLLPKE